jgi:hypothetical protein
VALFLSISDGIGKRIFKASPLSKRQLEVIEEWVRSRRDENPFFGWFWATISKVLPMNDDTANLQGYVNPLNRHAVLHGLRSDHGTKRHSLKAVSWLEYVSQFHDLASIPASQHRLVDGSKSASNSVRRRQGKVCDPSQPVYGSQPRCSFSHPHRWSGFTKGKIIYLQIILWIIYGSHF